METPSLVQDKISENARIWNEMHKQKRRAKRFFYTTIASLTTTIAIATTGIYKTTTSPPQSTEIVSQYHDARNDYAFLNDTRQREHISSGLESTLQKSEQDAKRKVEELETHEDVRKYKSEVASINDSNAPWTIATIVGGFAGLLFSAYCGTQSALADGARSQLQVHYRAIN